MKKITNRIPKRIPENWQAELEKVAMHNQTNLFLKRAYICSPCRSDTPEGIRLNMIAARLYMYLAHAELNMNAFAPHAYLPTILCDNISADRTIALDLCMKLVRTSDVMLVCGDRITPGMSGEITRGAQLGRMIYVFNESLKVEVRKIVTRAGADKRLVKLLHHNMMALTSEEITDLPEVA